MGYYSDAALCLNQSGWNQFADKFNQLERHVAEAVVELLNNCDARVDRTAKAKMWFWRDIKWYADDDAINFFDELKYELKEDDYLFIRIGENYDDSEIFGCYHDNPFGLGLIRAITCDTQEKANA